MPILYESYSPLQRKLRYPSRVRAFDVIRYPIPWPSSGIGCGTTTQRLDLPSTPAQTKITAVKFAASADIVTSGTPLTPVSAEVVFMVNGQNVGSQQIFVCTIPRCTVHFDIYIDVGAYVYFGKTNEFNIEVRQSWSPFGCVTGIENLAAYLEYEFTGAPPSQPTPPPPVWLGYVKWGLVGVGAIAVVGLVLPKAIEAIGKRKG